MSSNIKKTFGDWIFIILTRFYIIFFAIACFIPFIMVLSASFTKEDYITKNGYPLLPHNITLAAYKAAFKDPSQIFDAFFVSAFVTIAGTILSLIILSMTAYVLQRQDFKKRYFFAFFFYFTAIFGGGLMPWYILMTQYLHLRDNLLALILPGLFNVFYMIIIRTFIQTLPYSLIESAKIDGAGDFRVYWQIILPLSKPALAAMSLFISLGYWNDYFCPLLFITNRNLMPMQYFLYNILNKYQSLRQLALGSSTVAIDLTDIPENSLRMSTAVITTLPILFVYPFVQNYLKSGITIGAVKG